MSFATKTTYSEKKPRFISASLRVSLRSLALIAFIGLVSLGGLSTTARAQAQCPNASGCTQNTVISGQYTVTFVGVTCSGGNSTWCYDVTWTGMGRALSHVTFGVCEELTSSNLVGATINGNPTNQIEFGTDPTTGVFGVKFDRPGGLTPNVPRRFCFTLNRTDLSVAPLLSALKPGDDPQPIIICGPECPQAPTVARLSTFTATRFKDGRVEIKWETGYEADNLGFNIYRDDGRTRTLITPDLVAGSAFITAPGIALEAGMSYTWTDSLPRKARDVQYWIEDIDLNGATTLHGPFALELSNSLPEGSPVKNSPLLSSVADFTGARYQDGSAPVEIRAAMPSISNSLLALSSSVASQPGLKLSVKLSGLYRLSQPQLISAGLSPSVNPRLLQLFVDGHQIPIIVSGQDDSSFDPADFIEFFAVGLNSQFSSARSYFLTLGSQPGLRIAPPSSSSSSSPKGGSSPKSNPKKITSSPSSFSATIERRDKSFFFSSLLNGEDDNFFGPPVASAPLLQSLSLENIDFSSPTDALIEIGLQGLTLVPHQVAVSLNGQPLGSISFASREKGLLSLSIPHSLLFEGTNTVQLSRQAGSSDVSLVEFIRISYSHLLKADSDSLFLPGLPGQQVSITGFSSASVRLFDVTDPDQVSLIASTVSPDAEGGFMLSATVAGKSDRRLFAVADTQLRQVDSIRVNNPSSLRSTSNGANMVIITRSDLAGSLSALRSYRQTRGVSVMMVDVEDIYDEFSFGHKTPFAIREFLTYTQSWKKGPRYVVLGGDGTYDPRDNVGGGSGDVVPIKLVETETMETASDDWYVDFDGDALADIAIGRIPAKTPAEMSLMVSKIIDYERNGRTQGALLVSDVHDGLFDFEDATADVKSLIPSNERVDEIYRGQLGDAIARAKLIEGISNGPKVVSYVGHGTLTNWKGNILHANDAATLSNKNLTLFVSMTCLNGLFQNPTGDSLAEALIKSNGGAVAVWASSALTGPRNQAAMNREIVRQLFTRGVSTIGDATLRAKSVVADNNVRRSWILFGDPATTIK